MLLPRPTLLSSSVASCLHSWIPVWRCIWIVSVSCFPTVYTGSRLTALFWGMIDIFLPLIEFISFSLSSTRLRSSKKTDPVNIAFCVGMSRRMDRNSVLLPLPDSPTIPIFSPVPTSNETSSTALTSWSPVL